MTVLVVLVLVLRVLVMAATGRRWVADDGGWGPAPLFLASAGVVPVRVFVLLPAASQMLQDSSFHAAAQVVER